MTSSSRYCNRSQQRRSFLLSRLVTVVIIATNILRLRAFASLGKKMANRAVTSSSSCSSSAAAAASASSTCLNNNNPLLESWTAQPFSLPPFEKIEVDHFKPALEVGMEEHLKDLNGIVNNPDPPTFDNVIVAYDRSGSIFDKVGGVFGNMCSSQNTPELQKIQTDMTPILSRHSSATYTLPGLFEKIQQVFENDQEGLSDEDRRLIERIHLDFTRAGAHFTAEKQKENADIQAKLASLITAFSQNGTCKYIISYL